MLCLKSYMVRWYLICINLLLVVLLIYFSKVSVQCKSFHKLISLYGVVVGLKFFFLFPVHLFGITYLPADEQLSSGE